MNASFPFTLQLFFLSLSLGATSLACFAANTGWTSLFDGESLAGWKASENPDSIEVIDGAIRCVGPRAHLFYLGPDGNASFENFELSLEMKAGPGANSGVYFHTRWQDEGWPGSGLEAQVNNTQPEFHDYVEYKKTGSLYGIRNTYKALARDNEWFTMRILVRRPLVEIQVDDTLVVRYREPDNLAGVDEPPVRPLGSGTFALQCHDENSEVFYRNIRVKRLPDGDAVDVERPVFTEQEFQLIALGRSNFPVADLHTIFDPETTVEHLLDRWRRTGIFAGIGANEGSSAPVSDAESAEEFLGAVKNDPVFAGLKIGEAGWEMRFPAEMLSRFDYLVADAATDAAADTERDAIDRVIDMIRTLPIDILANPTWVTADTAAHAEEFWTEERAQRIIDAAVESGVAFEINAHSRTPSIAFIKQAKASGARFTIGTGEVGDGDRDDWSYPLLVQAEADLSWRDMFVPGHQPTRAQQLNR